MSNLDNLVSKIIRDCEEQSQQILNEAEAKASEIIKAKESLAQKEVMQILQAAEAEAIKAAEQIRLGKKLKSRDENLDAKQSIIDKVFAQALLRLNELPEEGFREFLKNSLQSMELDGEELLLPAKYEITNIEELNAYLKENGKKGNLKLYEGARTINSGFILIKNGIEDNYTFEALIRYYRYELEQDIIENLF